MSCESQDKSDVKTDYLRLVARSKVRKYQPKNKTDKNRPENGLNRPENVPKKLESEN